jgi:hypothetical protein
MTAIPTTIVTLFAALKPQDFDALSPIERRRFADTCRYWANVAMRLDGEAMIAESKTTGHKSGILGALNSHEGCE